jgi:hypothetical protein
MLHGNAWLFQVALVGGVGYCLYKAWHSTWDTATGWLCVAVVLFAVAWENAHPYTCDTQTGTCTLDADNDSD